MKTRIGFLALALAAWTAGSVTAGEKFVFPSGFLWGTATAAHQVEGNNTLCDWWDWEQVPGHIRNGDRSGKSDDHYHLFAQDLALARALHNNAYRFSIEWARLEPEEGRFDEQEVAHYRAVLEACKANGLKPIVTLFHFTVPRWFAAKGGWLNPGSVKLFERFAAFAGSRFGDLNDVWCTLNEPVVYVGAAYLKGIFPPGVQDLKKALAAMENLAKAHAAAYHALHRTDRIAASKGEAACVVTIAKHMRIFDPYRSWNPLDVVMARVLDYVFNRAFVNALIRGRLFADVPGFPHVDVAIPGGEHSLDILGLNYYSRDLVRFNPRSPILSDLLKPEGAPTSDLGWEIYPAGFYRILVSAWNQYKLPILVTENGTADASDTKRSDFLRDHLRAMAQAMKDGVPVLGYMHWSLMDNFEWAEGFTPRFGLYAVDYATEKRTPTKGARLYSDVISANSIDLGPPFDLDPDPPLPEAAGDLTAR